MAGSKSDYLENILLNLVLGAAAFTAPANVYAALFTVTPGDAGGGTEVTGGSYARVTIANNTTNFPTSTVGQKQNGAAITWPTATASWGTVVAVGLFDAATAGNLLYWMSISSKTVDSNDTVSIAINNLTITED